MTHIADLHAAFACRPPAGHVPRWEIEFHAWDALSGRHVVLGEEFARLPPGEQERALHTNAEIMLAVCDDLGFAALTVPGGYWYHAPGELAYYVLPGEARYRQCEVLRDMAGESVMLVAGASAVLSADYSMDFCERLFERPEEVDAQAAGLLAYGLGEARRFRDLGVGAVFTASDIADNAGPFFNPAQMERFILPYLRDFARACRDMGLYAILHSDGNLTRYLDALADTGLHALQAIDPVAGMDLPATKQAVAGRLSLCGNIDCGLLLNGPPEGIYAATRDLLTAAKSGGGLVLGASNAVQPDVPADNYRAMAAAWREHGGYRDTQED